MIELVKSVVWKQRWPSSVLVCGLAHSIMRCSVLSVAACSYSSCYFHSSLSQVMFIVSMAE